MMQDACTQFFESAHVCIPDQSLEAQISLGFERYRIGFLANFFSHCKPDR